MSHGETRFLFMNPEPLPQPDPNDVALLQHVQQLWTSGNQPAAVDALRSKAEGDNPWAAALMAWLLMQQGYPGIEESITWAIRAAEGGCAGQLSQTFNNVMAHIPSYPQLAVRLPELLKLGLPWSNGFDPVGQAWNLVASGQPELGLQVLLATGPWPEQQMSLLVEKANSRLRELETAVAEAGRYQDRIRATADEAQATIKKSSDDLETSAKQAGLLVTATTSDATNSLFKADAARNAKESHGAWVSGLFVLSAAAIVAVLPVVLHYLNVGVDYSALEQIGLHLVSTAALATVAGVLLARARARDQAAQRAHDLSTAMGTMISYSNQISDPSERQRFMTTMSQIVLQAHLTSGPKQGGNDDNVSGMLALANMMKPSTLAPGPGPT